MVTIVAKILHESRILHANGDCGVDGASEVAADAEPQSRRAAGGRACVLDLNLG
jgi:hypothetical protein